MNGVIAVAVTLLTFLAAEGLLRLKNSNMKNYDIEMWKYGREMTLPHPLLGHIQAPDRSGVFQGVEIRTNSLGMRSPEPAEHGDRRILFLGSSITLGWGVKEEESLSGLLWERFAGEQTSTEVLNGGVANYNATRYVGLFFEKFQPLQPTDIVIHYFLNDVEILPPTGGNWLLRHSQLAVTLWIAYQRATTSGGKGLEDHYAEEYDPSSPGYKAMKAALEKLAAYAEKNHIRLYLAMTPEIHFLTDYPFEQLHRQVGQLARESGYRFIDLFPPMKGIPFEELQTMPGDAHPNAGGHKIMADAIYEELVKQ